MSTNLIRTANPSRSILPTFGAASSRERATVVDARMCGTSVSGAVRTHVLGAKAVIQGYFPGTSAWSPPIC
ncbi:MAG: hypothetical protein R2731_11860 [Nocardioides sp.]